MSSLKVVVVANKGLIRTMLTGTLYVEANNPECVRAASICRHLEKKGVLSCRIVDITSKTDIRSEIEKRIGSALLPLLDLVNIGLFHHNTMQIYFSSDLRDFNP